MFSPGAVAVADGSVLLAGPKADVLRAAPAGFARMEFPGAAIVPGLVNAHTHLQIPRFADPAGGTLPIPPSFVDWIFRVIAWRLGATPASFSANFQTAADEALSFGTTAVGEIAGPDLSSYDGCPLRARIFAEGIGFAPHVAPEVLALVGAAIDRLEKISAGEPPRPGGSVPPHAVHRRGKPPSLPRGARRRKGASRLPAPGRVRPGDGVPHGRRRGDRLAPVPRGGEGRLLVPRSRADDPRVPRRDRSFAGRGAAGA